VDTSQGRIVLTADSFDEDRRMAEVFDALSHPTRIRILKALSRGGLGFADLKKKTGIESSGHLQHHLSKLGELVKTDDYGKYSLSDQGKDALNSVETVEKVAVGEPRGESLPKNFRGHFTLKVAVVALVLMLAATSALAVFEYDHVSVLENSISVKDSLVNQLSSAIDRRDTFISQLDTALNLAQSRLYMNLPNGSQYLRTLPTASNEGSLTKILLESTSAWYHYGPAYPFNITWFNEATHYGSSVQMIPLTKNRSVPVSFYGFNIGSNDNYEYTGEGGDPYLMIGLTVRNDYTSADAGNGSDPMAPIGDSTPYYQLYQSSSAYVSFVNLSVKLISQNGSIIPAVLLSGIQTPTNLRTLERGGECFPIESGETKQVVFYLYPSNLNIAGFVICVSYLSSIPPP
jgi:DNA-binding transcriptional ArsR family regulator